MTAAFSYERYFQATPESVLGALVDAVREEMGELQAVALAHNVLTYTVPVATDQPRTTMSALVQRWLDGSLVQITSAGAPRSEETSLVGHAVCLLNEIDVQLGGASPRRRTRRVEPARERVPGLRPSLGLVHRGGFGSA